MDLILWRHAEAHDAADGQSDLERALTARGEKQARRVAAWLNQHLPSGAKVLVSPARRTQQTADALERRFKTVEALAPGEGVEALLAATRWPDARDAVLVVGHQPTLGLTAGYLLTGQALAMSVRKGGVWWLRGRERDGGLQVAVHAVIGPDLV